ncbi:MAG: YtxH domain-containing protein [Bacillaceae bacterium]|nr:YtxH domain-containing protein [Bacillaceae bacterium]
MSKDNMNVKDFFIGALIGGIVGATTSLLMAPKSGKELRNDLVEQAHTMKEKTSSLTSNAIEKGNKYAQFAKEKSSTIAKTVTEQSAYVADKVKELTENVKK